MKIIIVIVLATLLFVTLFTALLLPEPAHPVYAKTLSHPVCQQAPYGCTLPQGFKGWPQLP